MTNKFYVVLAAMLAIVSCGKVLSEGGTDYDSDDTEGTGNNEVVVPEPSDGDVLVESEYSRVVNVKWNGANVTVSPADVLPAHIDGGNLVLGDANTSVNAVKLVLSGSSNDGSIKVYNQKKYLMVLDNLTLTSQNSAPVNNQCRKRLFLKFNGINRLSDVNTYAGVPADEDCKAALFSEGQIVVVKSEGSLEVVSKQAHAIASDDYIILGPAQLKAESSVKDGIHAKEYLVADGTELLVNSCGEGIDSEGSVSVVDGKIEIHTTGEKSHAIRSITDMSVSGGEIVATTAGKASKCLKSANNIVISGGVLDLKTTGDALYDSTENDVSSSTCIKATNNISMSNAKITCVSTGSGGKGINCYQLTVGSSEDDALDLNVTTSGTQYKYSTRLTSSPKAIRSTDAMIINGGKITVKASGKADGSEGIESKTSITINGGQIDAETYDDCINAGNSIVINGGNISCYASNNDGIDSNGTITVTGGTIYTSGSFAPEEGMDCDRNTFAITGGVIMSFGGATSYPTPSACTQYSSVINAQGLSSATQCSVKNASGDVVMSFTSPARTYSSCTVLLSHPDFSASSFTFVYGSKTSTFTPSLGSTSTGGGPGGGGPGGGWRP